MPAALVIYAGENDIAHGEAEPRAFADYQALIAAKHARMPGVPTLVISCKSTPER